MKFYILAVSLCLLGALGSVVEGKSVSTQEGIDPADLIVIGGNTYYISPVSILEDAFAATAYCDAEGMKLVSFETEEKWTAVQDYLASNTTYTENSFWSSLTKFGDSWRWGNGDFATYFDWAQNEPNENKAEVCVRFVASQGWFDQECKDVTAAFVCELINLEL